MAGFRTREHDDVAVARDEDRPPRLDPVRALQRSAGNAAVSASLRRGIQRDSKLPDDPHSLSDLSAVAPAIQIDKDWVSISLNSGLFTNPRIKARPGFWVETRFAGTMAAKTDDEKEKALRVGLGTIGMMIFGLDDPDASRPKAGSTGPVKHRPASSELTHVQDLDLTPFGGRDGSYRFTAVTRASGGGQKTEVDVIVEWLGARRAAFKDWKDLDSKRRTELRARFDGLGYTQAQATMDNPVDTWSDDQFGRVLQALEVMPQAMLTGVQGIVWERGHGAKSAKNEDGLYTTRTGLAKTDAPVRHLTIFDDGFKSDEATIEVVAHELGHAISNQPTETGGTALADVPAPAGYRAAATADSPHAVTKYGDTDWAEHYAEAYSMFIAQRETLRLLRPKSVAWFEAQQAAAAPAKATKKP